ncbi:MAG: hypothetical protein M1816_006882 [Peltula sp. TS41687]|nr:MAG: hypothetical protein M1816_006882 [Peltula sp. TS41687]
MPIPRSSYYDKDYKQSAALIRARRPYLVKNALTGMGIFAFTIGVCMKALSTFCGSCIVGLAEWWIGVDWAEADLDGKQLDAYTIHAISQDDFEDVPIPDAPTQPAKTPNVGTTTAAAKDLLSKKS